MRHSVSPSIADAPPTRRANLPKALYASLAVALIAVAIAVTFLDVRVRASEAAIDPICEPWDTAASSAVARLVGDTSDAAARQLGDAVFRLRRARKNCRVGWVSLACQDYRALLGASAHIALATECLPAVLAGAR
jgi:hypothetical protein